MIQYLILLLYDQMDEIIYLFSCLAKMKAILVQKATLPVISKIF